MSTSTSNLNETIAAVRQGGLRPEALVLALLATLMLIGGVLTFAGLSEGPATAFLVTTGTLMAGKFSTIVDFFFGSSSSSRGKDQVIADMKAKTPEGVKMEEAAK